MKWVFESLSLQSPGSLLLPYSVSRKSKFICGIKMSTKPVLKVMRKSSCSWDSLHLCQGYMGYIMTSLHISACLLNTPFWTNQILYTFYSPTRLQPAKSLTLLHGIRLLPLQLNDLFSLGVLVQILVRNDWTRSCFYSRQ